ncbi:type VII secretion integral membrane protein EccD [Rhodococcus marinonascens]|uniref:type VII secretion integral membrane protein EccD n=1 Tax=Rhodococcus marinonascens TaxID=38311 RepID=UPI000934FC99|nr:type VII secretion integral membrane protein EccD [Rhodococcus marinonascens]
MSIAHDESRGTTSSVRQSAATELCRITVLSTHSQVDMAVPFGVPLAILIPGIVDTIRSHRGTNDFDDSLEQYEPSEWVLAKIAQSPLSSTLTLHEHGIRDGDLLILESAQASAPPPLFDDIMYNVAIADAESDREWTRGAARVVGSAAAVLGIVVGSYALLWSESGTTGFLGAGCALLMGILFLIAGSVTGRVYQDAAGSVVLSGCAVPLAFAAGMLFVPGDLGAPHALLGLVLAGTTAVLALRLGGVGLRLFTGLSAISLFGSLAALVAMLTANSVASVGAGVVAASLIGLALSARMSILLAKLPLPPVPAPGTSVDPSEVDPDDDVTMPSFDSLAQRAARARKYLTGLVGAMTILVVAGALMAVHPGAHAGISWSGASLAVAAAATLMFRGRTYSSAEQAVPLIAGGVAILVLLLTAAAVAVPDIAIALFAAAIAFAVGALVLGILAPSQEFSPVMRRIAELIDLALIASIVPLVCWVTGLYSLMRGL